MTEASKAERAFTPEIFQKLGSEMDNDLQREHLSVPLGRWLEKNWHAIRFAIDALSAPVPCAGEKEGWRPIDTAPHQKAVLVARDGEKFIVEAYVPNPASGWRHVHSCDPVCFMPTHWQPLPLPPGATPSPPRQGVEREKIAQRVGEMRDAIDMIEGAIMGCADFVDLPKTFEGCRDEMVIAPRMTVKEMRRVCSELKECTRIINSQDYTNDAVLALLQPEGDGR